MVPKFLRYQIDCDLTFIISIFFSKMFSFMSFCLSITFSNSWWNDFSNSWNRIWSTEIPNFSLEISNSPRWATKFFYFYILFSYQKIKNKLVGLFLKTDFWRFQFEPLNVVEHFVLNPENPLNFYPMDCFDLQSFFIPFSRKPLPYFENPIFRGQGFSYAYLKFDI